MQTMVPQAASSRLPTLVLLADHGIVALKSPYCGVMRRAHQSYMVFFFKLTTDRVLVFDWIAGSGLVNWSVSAGLVVSFTIGFHC